MLVVGSGNLVHNLGAMQFGATGAYDWAEAFDKEAAVKIETRDARGLGDMLNAGRVAKLSHPTPEHFLPVLYPLAVADAIATLLLDRELAGRLGAAGAERAKHFAWPLIVERVEAVLLSALSAPPAPAGTREGHAGTR